MSIVSLEADPDCKVTLEDLHAQPAKLGVKLQPNEVDDYYKILRALDKSVKKILDMDDYYQPTFLEKYPRKNIHRPSSEDNKKGAWAYKVTIEPAKGSENRPLYGKTVCLKDCVEVAQVPQILGTDAHEPWIPDADATVVTRLLEAGATIVGLATCENQSSSTSSNSASTGNVENPYCDGYSAGGSSSGTGYLVGSSEVEIGIGADQGGSIRIPSAHCGIVGLKPTFGLVPYTGIASLETNIDHCGPMTRTVLENCELLLVIAGKDGFDDRQGDAPKVESVVDYKTLTENSSLKGMKIGILKESLEVPTMSEPMKQKFTQAADRFRQLGAEVVEISIPYHKVAPEIWMVGQRVAGGLRKLGLQSGRRILKSTKFFDHVFPWTQEMFDKTPVPVKNGVINGLYLSENYPSLYTKCINLSFKAVHEYNAALEKVDVLITPTTPVVAPPHGIRDGTPLELIASTVGLNSNTGIFNMTGHPALSLPMGFLPASNNPDVKLPVGLQIIGKHFDEASVYRAAYGWEKETNWKEF